MKVSRGSGRHNRNKRNREKIEYIASIVVINIKNVVTYKTNDLPCANKKMTSLWVSNISANNAEAIEQSQVNRFIMQNIYANFDAVFEKRFTLLLKSFLERAHKTNTEQ